MSDTFSRLLKIAEIMSDDGDIEGFNSICATLSAFIKKHSLIKIAHFVPENDGITPNPLRRNMDYAGWEHSPYYGSVSDFLKRFPGGIRDWVKWRNSTEKERYLMWDIKDTKKRMARLEILMKTAEKDEEDRGD